MLFAIPHHTIFSALPFAILSLAALPFSALPAFAWSKDDEKACFSREIDVDAKISACTRLLQAPDLTLNMGVQAHLGRGHGYMLKGESALAKADFDKFSELQWMAKSGGGGDLPYVELSVPPELDIAGSVFKLAVAASYHGKAFSFTADSQMYIGGIGEVLLDCQLPTDTAERTRLAVFVHSVAQQAALRRGATYLAGAKLAKTLDCSSPVAAQLASGLAKTLEANERPMTRQKSPEAASGGGAVENQTPFMRTCIPKFGHGSCLCFAGLAQGVIPDIHQKEYHRDLVIRVVQENPIVATQVGAACRIINY